MTQIVTNHFVFYLTENLDDTSQLNLLKEMLIGAIHAFSNIKLTIFVTNNSLHSFLKYYDLLSRIFQRSKISIMLNETAYHSFFAEFGKEIKTHFPKKFLWLPKNQFIEKYCKLVSDPTVKIIKL